MPLDTNLHHTRAQIQGTVQLLAALGATTKAAALAQGYLDMGNFLGNEIKGESKMTPRIKAYRGVARVTGNTPGLLTLGYDLTTKEIADARKMYFFLHGSAAAGATQSTLSSVSADSIAFSAPAPSVASTWYPILQSGVHVSNLTAVTVAGKTENTDFVVDYTLGMIRFLTTQTAAVVVVASGPKIAAGDNLSMIPVTPFVKGIFSGYFCLFVWDQDANNPLVWKHLDFSGDLHVTKFPKIDYENQSEAALQIDMTSDSGTMYHRD